jgi:hypothetical protein
MSQCHLYLYIWRITNSRCFLLLCKISWILLPSCCIYPSWMSHLCSGQCWVSSHYIILIKYINWGDSGYIHLHLPNYLHVFISINAHLLTSTLMRTVPHCSDTPIFSDLYTKKYDLQCCAHSTIYGHWIEPDSPAWAVSFHGEVCSSLF